MPTTAPTGAFPAAGKNFRILQKRILVEGPDGIHLTVVEAPLIARHAQAGQFVIVRATENSERIPLTIAAYDRALGTITLIFQVVGRSTAEMATLGEGDAFLDLLGPLGTPITVKKHEHPVVLVGGGVGVAPIWPKVKELYELGNHVITIIGARTKRLLILEEELRRISHEFYVTTDDGSYARKGFVTQALHDVIQRHEGRISEVVAVGPIPMMEAVVKEMAGKSFRDTFNPGLDYDPRRIPLIVSLNPIMVDGTGMCGGCRVQIWNPSKGRFEARFTCVDGPAFDGYAVDFATLTRRNRQYVDAERRVAEQNAGAPQCRPAGLGACAQPAGDGPPAGEAGAQAGGNAGCVQASRAQGGTEES
jgi:ferredoxin--NADP+ reductase